MSTSSFAREPEPELMDGHEQAEAYANADFRIVNAAFVERFSRFIGDGPVARVIDLGCGPADIAIRLAQRWSGWTLVVVEAADAMLAHACRAVSNAGLGSRVSVVKADATATNLPASSFDILTSNSLLHHLPKPMALWREIVRLGRSGAAVFVSDLARPASRDAAAEIVQRVAAAESEVLRRDFLNSLIAAYTVDEIRVQLEDAGLSHFDVSMVDAYHLDIAGRLP